MGITYFIAGALYQALLSFATVLVILKLCKITTAENTLHLYKYPLRILAVNSAVLLFAYAMEYFIAYYSGAKYELEALKIRTTGPYAWVYVSQIAIYLIPIILPFITKNLKLTTPLILLTYLTSKLDPFLTSLHL